MFISFTIIDAIDILLVAFLLYEFYMLVKGTVAIKVLIGVVIIYLLWYVVQALGMNMLSSILGQFIGVGVIALIIVFQQEVRRFLIMLGTRGIFGRDNAIQRFLRLSWVHKSESSLDISGILKACNRLSSTKTGALIVLARNSSLKFYVDSGDKIEARVSSPLIESIFFNNSPLHDGAIIIDNNIIKAARCILPVADDENFPAHLGFRHRAAVGITQNTDAISVTVSEETGKISYAKGGMLFTDVSTERLQRILDKEYTVIDDDDNL